MIEQEISTVSKLTEDQQRVNEIIRGMWRNSHAGNLTPEERIRAMDTYIDSLSSELQNWLGGIVEIKHGRVITRAMQIAAEELSAYQSPGRGGAKHRRETLGKIRREL